jgi:hypothetical protein
MEAPPVHRLAREPAAATLSRSWRAPGSSRGESRPIARLAERRRRAPAGTTRRVPRRFEGAGPGGHHEPRRHLTAKPSPEDPAYDIRPPFGPFQKEMSDCVNATFARGASAVRQWPTGAP